MERGKDREDKTDCRFTDIRNSSDNIDRWKLHNTMEEEFRIDHKLSALKVFLAISRECI